MSKCRYMLGDDNDYWSECHNGGFFLPADNMPNGISPYAYCPFCSRELDIMREERRMPGEWERECSPDSYV